MNPAPLHIPTPCHEAWDGMTPVANGRHCDSCNHAVVDITSMPVAEGRRVLDEVATNLHHDPSRRTCVRAHVAPSGRLVAGRRKLLTHALAAMLASTMAGCVGDDPEVANAPQPLEQTKSQPPRAQETPPLTGIPRMKPSPRPVEATMGDVCVPMGTIAPPIPAATSGRGTL